MSNENDNRGKNQSPFENPVFKFLFYGSMVPSVFCAALAAHPKYWYIPVGIEIIGVGIAALKFHQVGVRGQKERVDDAQANARYLQSLEIEEQAKQP